MTASSALVVAALITLLGSFAIGIAAVAVALSFPSAPRPSQPSLDLGRATA